MTRALDSNITHATTAKNGNREEIEKLQICTHI